MRRVPATQQAWQHALTVIEGGAHSIAWTHAEEVTKGILEFLP
jgi:hypothetical protein